MTFLLCWLIYACHLFYFSRRTNRILKPCYVYIHEVFHKLSKRCVATIWGCIFFSCFQTAGGSIERVITPDADFLSSQAVAVFFLHTEWKSKRTGIYEGWGLLQCTTQQYVKGLEENHGFKLLLFFSNLNCAWQASVITANTVTSSRH